MQLTGNEYQRVCVLQTLKYLNLLLNCQSMLPVFLNIIIYILINPKGNCKTYAGNDFTMGEEYSFRYTQFVLVIKALV